MCKVFVSPFLYYFCMNLKINSLLCLIPKWNFTLIICRVQYPSGLKFYINATSFINFLYKSKAIFLNHKLCWERDWRNCKIKINPFVQWEQLGELGTNGLTGNFIQIALRHGCSAVNLLHIFRTSFPKNTSGGLLFCIWFHM